MNDSAHCTTPSSFPFGEGEVETASPMGNWIFTWPDPHPPQAKEVIGTSPDSEVKDFQQLTGLQVRSTRMTPPSPEEESTMTCFSQQMQDPEPHPTSRLTPDTTEEQLLLYGQEIVKDRELILQALHLAKTRQAELRLQHEELSKEADGMGIGHLAISLGIDGLSPTAERVVERYSL